MITPATDLSNDIRFQEWLRAQGQIVEFDKLIVDIRKYGFVLITVLLGADGYLLSGSKIDPLVSCGICLALILLIVGLFLIDRMHEVFLRGAVLRAMDTEEKRGLGLSSEIMHWSEGLATDTWGSGIYLLFGFVPILLTVLAEIGFLMVLFGVGAGWVFYAFMHKYDQETRQKLDIEFKKRATLLADKR